MAFSGDFTLEEAIWVFTSACERCMNVLIYRYTQREDGYEEFSDDWKHANTECEFCRGIEMPILESIMVAPPTLLED